MALMHAQRIVPIYLVTLLRLCLRALLYLLHRLRQQLLKIFILNRFQIIVKAVKLHCLLCIIKIRVTGTKERHDSRPVFIDPFQQLQACPVRHLDIRQHQRDFFFFQPFHGTCHIPRRVDAGDPERIVVDSTL